MSRKVYFTREQLEHILGEDMINGGGYLDKTSTGSEYPTESLPATYGEVIMTEPGGDSRTEDAYAKQKIANNQWTRRGNFALYEDSKKKLNERNAELDGKNIYSLPNEVRMCATPDGVHDDIMKRLRSGEKMNLASLYRLRNELSDSSNTKVKSAIDSMIKRAQAQGASLRDAHSNIYTDLKAKKNTFPGKGHRKDTPTIYYENN